MGKEKRTYDSRKPENWTVAKLKGKLREKGVPVLPSYKKAQLVALWNQNEANAHVNEEDPVTSQQPITCANTDSQHGQSDSSVVSALLELSSTMKSAMESVQQSVGILTQKVATLEQRAPPNQIHQVLQSQTAPQTIIGNDSNVAVGNVSMDSCSTAATAGNNSTASGLSHPTPPPQQEIRSPGINAPPAPPQPEIMPTVNPLAVPHTSSQPLVMSTVNQIQNTSPSQEVSAMYNKTQYGYSAESLPFIETVAPQIRKNIIDGKDVNLASLLIPNYSGNSHFINNFGEKVEKPDPRLNRDLSIGEFIQAFSIYKSIMCEAYPDRRPELDLYERDIVDMASRYKNNGFYEYHRQFSSRAAAYLKYKNLKVDCLIRDNKLFCNIFANNKPVTCGICFSVTHHSGFCPRLVDGSKYFSSVNYESKSNATPTKVKEVCVHFNGEKGCFRKNCRYMHSCKICKEDHSMVHCNMNRKSNKNDPPKNLQTGQFFSTKK